MASSSDEGEIVENGSRDLKATLLPRTQGSGVDRQDRNRSRNSTPDHDSASRYSSSTRRSRSPRGFKRPRDDRSYGRRDQGFSRDHSRYGAYDDDRSSRFSYDDPDRRLARSPDYDDRRQDRYRYRDDYSRGNRDRDRYRERERCEHPGKRARRGSRSPPHRRVDVDRSNDSVRHGHSRHSESSGALHYDDDTRSQQDSRSSRQSTEPARLSKAGANGSLTADAQGPTQTPVDEDYVEPEPFDEDAEIERRRKRREQLLAKSSSATPLLLQAVGAADKTPLSSKETSQPGSPRSPQPDGESPRTPASNVASPRSPNSPDTFSSGVDLLGDEGLANTHGKAGSEAGDGPSAADYDPTVDMKEDERRDELRHGQMVIHGEPQSVEQPADPVDEPTKPQVTGAGDDDDDFDMFADEFDEEKYNTKPAKGAASDGSIAAPEAKGGLLDDDDKDGYWKVRVGEVLNSRYQIQATLGRGMFSGVARAVDLNTKQLVAIKIMRNNDALRKGGYTEIAILEKLNEADPEDRKHVVKFERSFDFKGHLCMAFENLSMNLREVLRKFGNNVGINLVATRTYAHQIFVALAHMRKCSIIHADLKPDNILVDDSHKVLKICDLGTAIDRSDAATAQTEITPYLVSRFYRAPEIILGIPYDYGVDMWSIGCTLYEMYTGKILFAGDSNNQMLKAIMEVRGKLTPKLYKRGQLSPVHFDEQGQFCSVERDKVLNKTTVRTLPVVKANRDLRTRLMAASSGMNDAEARDLLDFVDLLEHCLALNPDKRIKPADALRHPFFASKAAAGGAPRRKE